MMRTQCLLGLRTFVAFAAKLWSFFIYLLRRQIRTVSLGWNGSWGWGNLCLPSSQAFGKYRASVRA